MRPFILPALLLVVVASAPACVRAQAKTPAAAPSLATPEPPDRVIVAVPEPEPEPAPPAAPPVSPPRSQNPVATPRASERPAPPVSSAAPPPPPQAPPSRVLQTTADPTQAEKQTRTLLAKAQGDLDRAAARPLNANSKVQADAARGFIRQAEEALQAKNFVLARELADKAVALAGQLAR
jgi:hypothetical protein